MRAHMARSGSVTRSIAGERGRKPLTGEDAEHAARGRAGVAAMKTGNRSRETGNVDLDRGALTNGGDIGAETTQHARRALHVLAGQEPGELAGPARQRG